MWPDVVVDLSLSVICFLSTCYPALVGKDTPKGEFTLQPFSTEQRGYGGDLLVFKETEHAVFAIHRLIEVQGQDRVSRINSDIPEMRIITNGCVNVTPQVYDSLSACCAGSRVTIK